MISPPFPDRRPSGAPRGFALLITIVLVAFLVLLLVGLATFTRVETQVSNNSQQQAKARQNALFAVNLAVGQLQKFAGPDQRITARADVLTSHAGSPTADAVRGDFDTYWSTRSRYWTGVWGNSQGAIDYDLRPDQISGRGVTPELLNWLISGNEAATYSFNGAQGGVTAGLSAASPRFLPGGSVANLATATATSTDVTIADRNGTDHRAMLLVGPRSVGAATAARNDFVAAPLVDISADGATVPGVASAGPVVIGRYAWWAGDEGIKARANQQNGYVASGAAADQIESFLTTQRAAIETMERTPGGAVIGTAFDGANPGLPRLLELHQLPFLAAAAPDQAVLSDAASSHFHDLTTRSNGVLSDTYAGGLKKDLTADFASGSALGSMPADAEPLFTPLVASDANLPTWGHLRSWARQTAAASLPPAPPSNTAAGFGPVLLYASLGLDVFIDAGNVVRVAFYPVAVLSNPYPVSIDAADYDLGFRLPANANLNFQLAAPVPPANTAPGAFGTVATMHLGSPSLVAGTSASGASNFIRFTINGSVIPAGESHVYRLDDAATGTNYSAGARLVRAPNAAMIGLSNHLLLADSVTLDPSTTSAHFFRIQAQNVSSIDVALAQPGSLGAATGEYQACNVMMSNGVTTLIHTTASTQQILNNWDQPTQEARAAIRFGTPLEHRGNYSQMAYFGMPTQAMSWLRFANVRAPFIRSTTLESAAPGLPSTSRSGAIPFGAGLANDSISTRNVALFPTNNAYAINLSGSADASTSANTNYATLFDVLESPDRLLSLGQLQNAPLSRYSFYPSYPLGNSMADPRVDRLSTYRGGIVIRPGTTATTDTYYDLSWHLNRTLWDRFFVSGVPAAFTQADLDQNTPLPNSRLKIHRRDTTAIPLAELRHTGAASNAYEKAASHLLVSGAFNINSTSEQAWRAVLGASLGLPANSDYAATGASGDRVEQIAVYPRISRNLTRAGGGPYPSIGKTMAADSTSDQALRHTLYHGNRGLYLDDPRAGSTNPSASAVIDELARTIVREIRTRGPFLSLSDFVNRPILAARNAAGIKGALQSAIDTMEPAAAQANPFAAWNSTVGASMNAASLLYASWDSEHYIGGPNSEVGTNRDAFRFNYSFSPKYLTQADLLSALGPQFSARSDTFVIRTYGEVVNPATQTVEGRAWCEAVVQRVPEYADPSLDLPEDTATGTNIAFGRRLKIVSFRWLSPSEI